MSLRWRKDFPLSLWINDGYGKQQNEAKLWDRYWPAADRPMPDPLWPKATEAKRATNGYLYSKPIAVGKSAEGRPPHFFDWAPDPQPETKTADHQVVDWAIGELMQRRPRPFFQAVGIFRPHIPWYAPEKYFALYPKDKVFLPRVKKDDLGDVPPAGHRGIRKAWHEWLVKNDEWRGAVRGYLASISFADAQVGGCWMRWTKARTRRTRSLYCGPITACTSARSSSGKNSRCLRNPRVCL